MVWEFCNMTKQTNEATYVGILFSKHSLLDFAGDTQSVSWKKLYKKSQLRSLH
jgi:hypothetical protein